MKYKGFVASLTLFLICGLSNQSLASTLPPMGSWNLVNATAVSAIKMKSGIKLYAALVLPNPCYNTRIQKVIPTDPKSPQFLVQGQVRPGVCNQVITRCVVSRGFVMLPIPGQVVVASERKLRRVSVGIESLPGQSCRFQEP